MSARIAAVVVVVAGIAVLAPTVLQGERPSLLSLILLAGVLFVAGLVIRRSGRGRTRTIGSTVAALGAVAFVALLAMFGVVLQTLGRPY